MTKHNVMIRRAVSQGYSVDKDGNVFGPTGRKRKLKKETRRGRTYYKFNVAIPRSKSCYAVAVHRLIAFLKYGEAALKAGIVCRHLNDVSLDNSWDNIAIGSISDNALDRLAEDRKKHAQRAGRANSRSEEFWEQITQEHAAGASYKTLCERHGLSKGTLSYRLSKTGKRTVLELQ